VSGENPTAGTDGLGGGGGGAKSGGSGATGGGGDGVAIFSYLTAEGSHTGGNSSGTNGAYTWVKFTSDGTFSFEEAGAGATAQPAFLLAMV